MTAALVVGLEPWSIAVLESTDQAMRHLTAPRFFRSERGYQGWFYCHLQRELDRRGLLVEPCILEMEYQKSRRHGMEQRPDIILHIPAEESGAHVAENNFVVWALKLNATEAKAAEDFTNLDEIIGGLGYRIGIFVNVASTRTFARSYSGGYADRIFMVAVTMENGTPVLHWDRARTD
jgi:hypothetical protein